MITFYLVLTAELLALYFLTEHTTKVLYSLILAIVRSRYGAIAITTLIYLPGTVVHELSHLIVAEILRVPTGEISFTPKIANLKGKSEIEVGSLKIGQTDPLRRLLIGIAPLIFGLATIFLCIGVYQYYQPQLIQLWQQIIFFILIGYLLFAISASMFSSKKDLENSNALIILFVLIIIALYASGIRFGLTGQAALLISNLFNQLIPLLGIVIGIDFLVLLLHSLLLHGVKSITGKK